MESRYYNCRGDAWMPYITATIVFTIATMTLLNIHASPQAVRFNQSPSLRLWRSSLPTKECQPPAAKNSIVEEYSIKMQFSEHRDWASMSHDSDHLWSELLPANGGFLISIDGNGDRHKEGLSMFHQFHCLGMIRKTIQDLLLSEDAKYHEHDHGHDYAEVALTTNATDKALHWQHCFDYLRQNILCVADNTVEPWKVNTKGKEIVDGMFERNCRNADDLYKAVAQSEERAGEAGA